VCAGIRAGFGHTDRMHGENRHYENGSSKGENA